MDAEVFYHVKSLTEPLGLKMGRPYPLVVMMLMTYDGVVAHDGLVRHLALVPALTESAVGELEAMYAEAVKEARIAKPWGPGTGKLDPAILAQPHIKAIIGSAAMLHPEFAVPFPALETIADVLHMTPRTVQRKLQEEDTSFRIVCDTVKAEIARTLLTNLQLPISEIAFKLGYGEVSSFHRAFKQWVGVTPAEYRKG